MISKLPQRYEPTGDKQPLPWNVFNTTNFEALMNSGALGMEVRGDVLPTKHIPNYLEVVAGTNLSLSSTGGGIVQPMVGLALGTGSQPLADYMNWKKLSTAYADAYRLLFARAMVDILTTDYQSSQPATGYRRVTTEAVVIEPVFAYVVEAFLGVVSICTIALLVLSLFRRRNLRTDPSTIASLMAIVAENQSLLSDLAELDCCTIEDMRKMLEQKRYKLINDDTGSRCVLKRSCAIP
jgi:hypothetical protein